MEQNSTPRYNKPIVLRIDNAKADAAYIRLFDNKFSKDRVIIDVPEMDTPDENGHLVPYTDLLKLKEQLNLKIGLIYIWNPQLHMHLDLFTLHYYQKDRSVPGDGAPLNDVRVLFPRLDPMQMQPAIFFDLEEEFDFSRLTEVSFIVPAMTKTIIHFYPIKGAE